MSAVNLKISVYDESSVGLLFTMTGLSDEAVTPNTFNWMLTDDEGTVINSHSSESETPGSTTAVLLQGDDLAYADGEIRKITIWGTYNTTLNGEAKTNAVYTGEYQFSIRDFVNIT